MSMGRRAFYAFILLVLALSASFLTIDQSSRDYDVLSRHSRADFSWDKIKPSDTLDWTECFEKFQCSRLNVPLNYSDPDGRKAAIAVIRSPSPLLNDSSAFKGPILFNPGGPGGSGVTFLQNDQIRGLFREIVGPAYDLVSFDPRGIAASTPRASFFETEVERQLWKGHDNEATLPVVVNSTIENARNWWAKARILGELAADSNEDSFLQHINTENTARDMLHITEKYGWEKLKYWGFSYGTILGATYASILPDKVERLIIDGVAPIENYYSGGWNENLYDTSKTMQTFYTSCHAAGPSVCSFWSSTPSEIEANLTQLYDQVKTHPVPVRSGDMYGVVDYVTLRGVIFSALYKPYAVFPNLADALADLKVGNGTKLVQMQQAQRQAFECSCDTSQYKWWHVSDGSAAVACNDGTQFDGSLEAFEEWSRDLYEKSDGWGNAWDRIHLSCVNYPNYGKNHFQGPIGANTSFPLLIIGNTADPVTPLRSAAKAHTQFPGSSLLTQDSPGHCSLSAPSLCTARAIRAYFQNGTLLEEGTVCSVDKPIFSIEGKGETMTQDAQRPFGLDDGDEKLLALAEKASKAAMQFNYGPLGLL